jgi:hemerythrin
MAYHWDASLETGHERIDNQHKQLIQALNNLMAASAGGKGQEEIFKTLDFLTGYTIKHFADEEKIQIDYGYPDYLVHKRYHDEFKQFVGDMVRQIRAEGPTELLIGQVTTAIGDWLLNHIKGDDFRMAAYVKSQGGE